MLTTQRKQFIELARPRSFVGLMSLYDNNYRKLQRLLGGFSPEPGEASVSRVPGDVALHIEGLACSKFTHTFRLTYLFDGVPDPDLVIRVYHDARLAEAMNCSHRHRHRLLRRFATDRGGELQQRWMRNLMLNKWLEYCHERGHRFGPVEVRVNEPIDVGLR